MMPFLEEIRARIKANMSISWIMVLAFFAILLVTGLLIYQDYGISWDESTQLELGTKTYRYLIKHDPALFSFRDRYYGPFFELALVLLQKDRPPQDIYFSRHLLNFLAFFGGCLAMFGLGKILFKKTELALLGCLLLVLSPRIFADSFYNSKDIPFLVFYLFSLLTLFLFIHRPTPWRMVLHALTTAMMLATRLPGLVIPLITVGVLLLEVITRRMDWKRAAWFGLSYVAISLVLMVCFWPALWPSPLTELKEAFQMMRNFPHLTGMLFFGQTIRSDALPWFYIPAWVVITTPLLYVVLFLFGLASMLIQWLRIPKSLLRPSGRNEMILVGSILSPLAAVILLKSTLYDGWRQMFFIYPPMLLVALYGVDHLLNFLSTRFSSQKAALALVLMLGVGTAPVLTWMVANHPYQNVFFNRLAGPNLEAIQSRFSVDYWGLSYRQGLAYLLETDPSATISVFVETEAGERNAAIFPPEQQVRLQFVKELSQAKYYISNFDHERSFPFENRIFTVQVENTPILAVFLLDKEETHKRK